MLAGVASTGQADIEGLGSLVVKLGVFAVLALVLGAAFAHKLVGFVDRFRSEETLLITGLMLCFGLALTAELVGLSAAAGAFLIGAVLGDSQHARQMERTMGPVRNLFGIIFFVSIGMLVDLSLMDDYIVPTLVVAAVFIVGKVVSDTAGAFLTGENGRVSLSVGLGMPQLGEFSLAMVRTGATFGAVGVFLYPVVAGATVVTALFYPFLFRAADPIANLLERRSPNLLKRYAEGLVLMLLALRGALRFSSPRARQVQRSGRLILLELGIIAVFLALGTGSLGYTAELADVVPLSESMWGLVIGSTVLALCVPPAVAIWRSLGTLTDTLVEFRRARFFGTADTWTYGSLRQIFRDTALVPILLVPLVWSIPMVTRLLALGSFSAPLSLLIVAGIVTALIAATFRIHRVLRPMFTQTLLGEDEQSSATDSEQRG